MISFATLVEVFGKERKSAAQVKLLTILHFPELDAKMFCRMLETVLQKYHTVEDRNPDSLNLASLKSAPTIYFDLYSSNLLPNLLLMLTCCFDLSDQKSQIKTTLREMLRENNKAFKNSHYKSTLLSDKQEILNEFLSVCQSE